MLDDTRVDSPAKVGMLVSHSPGLVANGVVDVLETAFAEELVAGFEGDLDEASEFDHLLGRVVFYIGEALDDRV